MFLAKTLKYYKERVVQEAHLRVAEDREVSPRYGEGFGKRPDVLSYPNDILEFAKRKATSFHCSEERWRDPLSIKTGMSRKELDDLRIGWDLVLDIDCPDWEFSKLTTWLFIKALKDHDIKNISCKFSGNKGFHIGVPFESFPKTYGATETKNLFPEGPRALALYLLNYIEEKIISVKNNKIFFGDKLTINYDLLKKRFPVDLLKTVCSNCKKERKEISKIPEFICSCGHREKKNVDYLQCSQCGSVMERFELKNEECHFCGNSLPPIKQFNVSSIIEVDTVLLASRHLFRMPYSLHEKSGLASVVINSEDVLNFEKDMAKLDCIDFSKEFLIREGDGEATNLFNKAMSYYELQETKEHKHFEAPEDAIEQKYFPPCIQIILKGLQDGKKRSMFILTNFLKSVGWTHEMISELLYEWNKRHPEPMREVIIKGHLQNKKKYKEIILPPNCSNDYYSGLQICKPDDFCKTIKNPAQYTLKKYRMDNYTKDGNKKKERVKLTAEQLAMRRKYRRKMKEERQGNKEKTKEEKSLAEKTK